MAQSEYEKMMAGEWYLPHDMSLSSIHVSARRILQEYNQTDPLEADERRKLLEQLCGFVGKNVFITPPFFCDYGKNLELEDGVYMNLNCTILDCNKVHIGAGTLLGPNVQIYAVVHPMQAQHRATGAERSVPVTIGKNVWIGGAAVILPGVTIGDNSVIGAGSVVTKDVPANVFAAGNPCRVIKEL